MSTIAAYVCGGVAGGLALGALWTRGWRSRRRAGRTPDLTPWLAASPDAWVAIGGAGVLAVSSFWPVAAGAAPAVGSPAATALDGLLPRLATPDAAVVRVALARLVQECRAFSLRVPLPDGSAVDSEGMVELHGQVGPAGSGSGAQPVMLWLRDVGADAAALARARAEGEAATLAHDRLRAALDALPQPVWLRGADHRLLWCNAAYAHAVGRPAVAVVAAGVELLTGPEAPGPVLAARACAAGGPVEERRRVVVAGDLRLLRVLEAPLATVPPVSAPPAAPHFVLPGVATVGFAQDVTREQELSVELDRHILAQGEVMERLGSAIALYGADTRMTFHNRAYAALWGLDTAFLAGRPSYGEVLEDLRTRRRLAEEVDFPRWKRQRLAQFQDLREPVEELAHLPDGSTLRRLIVPHPLGGLMFVEEDVTNALALESSYNTLMAVQQETLDNLAEGVAVFGGDGRLKLWNPAYARLWRLSPGDLQGEPHIAELMEKARPLLTQDDDWAAQRDRVIGNLFERTAFAGRIERRDRSVVSISTVPLPDGAVLISHLDVTDSVRVEEALRASNEALATADRLKSEFIANVSHQLRTPLNAIMGFAEILNNQYFGPLNERQADYAKGLLDASGRLLALINDMLDLATIEAGFMELRREPVVVAGMLDSVAQLAMEWAGRRGVTLETHVAPGAESLVGDERRLRQALYNLVSNALKFTPSGGKVVLSAERDGEGLVLAVSDTGIGIAPDDRARMLNRFERGDAQEMPAAAGLGAGPAGAGLGLALVKSLIELHGGRVEIASLSTEGGSGITGGTVVRCHLPLQRLH